MKAVTLFDAKTHLSGLINEVLKNGEDIAITRHGHTVAMLVPVKQAKENDTTTVIKNMRALRAEINKKKVTLKEIQKMREEGRK